MSKIAITPNVSGTGTFTIAAPNSDTDRTLTLPDAAGAVVIDEAGGGSVKIDSNGNMGIGTTNPAQKLHIYGTDQVIYNQSVGSGSTPVPGLSLNRSGATSGLASQSIQFDVGGGGGGVDIYTLREISAGGTLIIRTDNTSGTKVERMRIDSAGRVTMPYQVGFYARRSIAGDGRGVNAQEWSVNGQGSYNQGGHFNTSNGRFTAPVGGRYYFASQPGYKQSSIDWNWYFDINGTHMAEPVRVIGGLNSHSAFAGSMIVALNAGDYVTVYAGNTHHVNTTYNYFCGHLIG